MRTSFRLWFFLALAAAVLPTRQALAWIDTGHKIIALIAWDDLTPKTKAAVTELLKQHPRFEKDLLAGVPSGTPQDEIDREAFANAATWPDMIRQQGHPMHAAYNHPTWHFIDIPYVEPGGAAPATQPAATQGSEPRDAIEALNHCSAELKDPSAEGSKRAIDLCWIEHVVGDIHQPLHAVSLYSPQFPDGDRGGNSEILLRDPPYPDSRQNLHHIWDALPGDYQSLFMDEYVAEGVRNDPQFSRAKLAPLLGVTDFMDWAKESNKLAVDDAYLDGKLKSAAAAGPSGTRTNGQVPGVPADYIANSEHVAMHQVALAGYRLADLLNSIFDPKQ